MIVLGIDPDLHRTGWALVESNPLTLKQVGIASTPTKFKNEEAVIHMRDAIPLSLPQDIAYHLAIVESQEVYFAKAKANPNNLILLAQVAGICAAATRSAALWMPRPGSWKGQVPKDVHQDRILRSVGLNPVRCKSYCFPSPLPNCPIINLNSQSDWKHVVDAIGLACWGIIRSNRLQKISERTHELRGVPWRGIP